MAMDAQTIENLIKEALPDAEVKIEDLRGDGDHYSCSVISSEFTGKSRSYISNSIRIVGLPDQIKELLSSKKISLFMSFKL